MTRSDIRRIRFELFISSIRIGEKQSPQSVPLTDAGIAADVVNLLDAETPSIPKVGGSPTRSEGDTLKVGFHKSTIADGSRNEN